MMTLRARGRLVRLATMIWLLAGLLPSPPAEANGVIDIAPATGLAIAGYDPVAYFTDHQAIPGKPEFAASFGGAIWQFASAEHRAAFQQAPERYVPQYGGHCAWAVAEGYSAHGDPKSWHIAGDKLYLTFSPSVQAHWLQGVAGYIEKADAKWQGLHAKLASQPPRP